MILQRICVIVSLLCVIILSCVPRKTSSGKGSYLLSVSIDNIDKDIEDIANIKYVLICSKSDGSNYYVLYGDKQQNDNKIIFNSKNIQEGDKCSLEVRGDSESKDSNIEYVWLTNPTAEGLFYSSNIAEISVQYVNNTKIKSLNITLFKLFSIKYKDAFTLELDLKFPSLYDAEFNAFNQDIVANLTCSNHKIYSTSSYQNIASSDLAKKFIFTLSASQLLNISCHKVTIIAKQVNLYEASLSDLQFTNVSKDQRISKDNIQLSSLLDYPSPSKQVKCVAFNAQKKCIGFTLPRNTNYWVAVINAIQKIGSNEYPVQYLVTRGNPITLDRDYTHYDIQDMQLELQASSGKYHFFDIEVLTMIKNQEFNPQEINRSVNLYRPTSPDMSNVTLVNIDSVHIHGIFEITQKELNSKSNPRWFGFVRTYSILQGINEFIIAANKKYFISTNKIINNSYYFDWMLIKQNNIWDKFLFYALKTSLTKPDKCNLDMDYLVNTISEFSVPQLSKTSNIPSIDNCNIVNNNVDYNNVLAIIRLYVFGWKEFKL